MSVINIPKIGQVWQEYDIRVACEWWDIPDLWERYKLRKGTRKRPFVSDGPSGGFPRYWNGIDLYPRVAAPHDLGYWLGGTALEKYIDDCYLAINAAKTTGDPACGEIMKIGVTIGGNKSPFHCSYEFDWGAQEAQN
jgi:hypothetical protein